MSDEDHHSFNETESLIPHFAVPVDLILNRERKRIVENQPGGFETETVARPVYSVFLVVPIARHLYIIV